MCSLGAEPNSGSSQTAADIKRLLLDGLTPDQQKAVRSRKRRVLIVAGAGSGKTEVMARRVAWWVAVEGVPKDSIVAFTFTERAAEEMKFRIRSHIQRITPPDRDATLSNMCVGTIHGFCLKLLRELRPDTYHNFDVLDDAARLALVQRGYHTLLGLAGFEGALRTRQYATMGQFLLAYDLLNEYAALDVRLASAVPPHDLAEEAEWCKAAVLQTSVGKRDAAKTFAVSAARYYAYLRSRRFLDFSTSQSELVRLLDKEPAVLAEVRGRLTHVVVDEVQDINPVQDRIIRAIVGSRGRLTAVGDHRQAIYGWRGGRVEIMGELYRELGSDADGEIVELTENFRSTPRIIDLSNRWAKTIGAVRTMTSSDMRHGKAHRKDLHPTHVAAVTFDSREHEAAWIAATIEKLVRPDGTGAAQDAGEGRRGISYSDVAILIRTSTDAKTYMSALEGRGIAAVVRAGPDLFSQPEVLLFVGALAQAAGIEEFYGAPSWNSLPKRIRETLGCDPTPEAVIREASRALRAAGLPMLTDVGDRLVLASTLMQRRIAGEDVSSTQAKKLRAPELTDWLLRGGRLRRVFPQTLFHYLLGEAGVAAWDAAGTGRARTAMFHLGQLSAFVTAIETPGWNAPRDFKYQIIALYMHGAQDGRTEEAPLLVQPDAVTVTTIHSAKGLEFAAVFVADVVKPRFPNSRAKTPPVLPFDGPVLKRVNPAELADNANYDDERRLMYVALTRAERYLFVTCLAQKQSDFHQTVEREIAAAGGTTGRVGVPTGLRHLKSEYRRELRLATSFSDLRYYLECPHDFYLRKVLGFAPTIDQAFGYGRGVHNLLREVHSNPKAWAALAGAPDALARKLRALIERGLFYLRYTTGEPLELMRTRAVEVLADYVGEYARELAQLEFEPEHPFETLIEEEQVLISGAIDVVRLDDPPRVSLIDFKSGEAESDGTAALDQDEMRLQVTLYGLAAKHELEYEPDVGLVRYLGEGDPSKRQLSVALDPDALAEARRVVTETAGQIRRREFDSGPRSKPRNAKHKTRCGECDFRLLCGRIEARQDRGPRRARA